MAHDECRVEMIDGEPIRVHGSRAMDDEDKAAFALIVAAARAKFRADHPEPDDEPCDHDS